MSCICHQPVRPEFKDSYKDLLDKPKINGVPLDGDVNTDNLHIEYPHLANLPQINGVPITGNLTSADLGIKAGAQFKIVQQLPITDIDEATVYLVPVQVGQTDNIYQEWIYINNKWEKIGEPINIQPSGQSINAINLNVDITEFESFEPGQYFLTYRDYWPNGALPRNGVCISYNSDDPSLGSSGLHIRFHIENPYKLVFDDSFGLNSRVNEEVVCTSWGQFYGLIYVADGNVIMKGEWQWG